MGFDPTPKYLEDHPRTWFSGDRITPMILSHQNIGHLEGVRITRSFGDNNDHHGYDHHGDVLRRWTSGPTAPQASLLNPTAVVEVPKDVLLDLADGSFRP